MTGLTETEYLVAALEAGGVDYVTKPIKPQRSAWRAWACTCRARGGRGRRQTRNALDAFGYASITVRASDGRSCGKRRWRASCCSATAAPDGTPTRGQWRPSRC